MVTSCPVCDEAAKTWRPSGGRDGVQFECLRCYRYELTRTAAAILPGLVSNDARRRAALSHAIRKLHQQNPEPPIIGSELLKALLEETTLPDARQQLDNLTLVIGDDLGPEPAKVIALNRAEIISLVGAITQDDVRWLVAAGREQGIFGKPWQPDAPPLAANLTIAGWERYADLKRATVQTRLAFMAMPFGYEDLDTAFRACFRPAVAATGFQLRRLDESPPAGLIDDRLRVEIRRSRFLITDLTQENRGAYWEAGFAEGIGLPVIYTCERKWFEEKKTHFDTNHHHTIVWEGGNLPDAFERLKATIRATLPADAKMTD
jgi:hypothetical protein